MSIVSRRTVLVLAGILATGGAPGISQAQSDCEWYAKTALKQQQENERRHCGFKGPEWNSDLAGHLTWCRSVPPDMWKKQAQLREQQLADCARK